MSRMTEDAQVLWEAWKRTGAKADLDRVILRLYSLIANTVQNTRLPDYVDREDLESFLTIKLINTVKDYDPARASKLRSWAIYKLKLGIKEYCRNSAGAHNMTRLLSDFGKQYTDTECLLTMRLGRQPSLAEISAEMNLDPKIVQARRAEREARIYSAELDFHYQEDDGGGALEEEGQDHGSVSVPGPEPSLWPHVQEWLGGDGGGCPDRDRQIFAEWFDGWTAKERIPASGVCESRYHQAKRGAKGHLNRFLERRGITEETWR